MCNIIIRKALPEDAEKIIDINIEVWKETYKDLIDKEIIDKLQVKTKERIEKTKQNIKEKNQTYVAESDGKIVGYHTYGKTRDENFKNSGEIYAGYILKEYQGLGIGRKLAIFCMQDLLNSGYKTLVTKCLEDNPANEFHKSLGGKFVGNSIFKPLGIYVGKDNIYFHEDLKKSLEYNKNLVNNKHKKLK